MSDLQTQESETTRELLDFDGAELIHNPGPGSFGPVLHVWGQAPCINMAVTLDPVRYVRQPEYWAVHVNGSLEDGFCLEAVRSFHEIRVNVPVGTKGVVVVGSSNRQVIDWP